MGHWQEGSALVESYLMPLPFEGLLMLAGFDCNTADKLKTAYWAPRFMLEIPPAMLGPLKQALFTFLPQLRERVCSMSASAKDKLPSAAYNLETMEFASSCAVQDTLELADTAPDNPMVHRLQRIQEWQVLRAAYLKGMATGVSGEGAAEGHGLLAGGHGLQM